MPPRQQKNIRLNDQLLSVLKALSRQLGLDESEVIRLAILQMAKREKVKIPPKEET